MSFHVPLDEQCSAPDCEKYKGHEGWMLTCAPAIIDAASNRERVSCTASRQERSWTRESWVKGRASCPDCGRDVAVMVSGRDLFPRAKASKHLAPLGVLPSPYGASGGHAT